MTWKIELFHIRVCVLSQKKSRFFSKGRDLHIKQIITQLQDKKIVIVTGASGAGKSSLIFAGVVPNARAGFFKASYNNWTIVSFRPERSPLTNLATELSKELKLEHKSTYKELQFGFSALINLYKNSQLYINPLSGQWQKAVCPNTQKAQISRSKFANHSRPIRRIFHQSGKLC